MNKVLIYKDGDPSTVGGEAGLGKQDDRPLSAGEAKATPDNLDTYRAPEGDFRFAKYDAGSNLLVDKSQSEVAAIKEDDATAEIERGFDPNHLSGREKKMVLVIHRLVNLCKALADDANGSELTLDQFKAWAGNQNDISEQQVINWIKGL